MTYTLVFKNAIVLLTLYVFLAYSWRSDDRQRPLLFQLLIGLGFGLAVVVSMVSAIQVAPGVIFDGRTIFLSMASLFGGPVVGLIAASLATAYRVWLGGTGLWTGLGNIILPVVLGLAYRHLHQHYQVRTGFWQLLIFSLILHALSVLLYLQQAGLESVAGPVLLVFPPMTVLLGLIFNRILQQGQVARALEASEARLRAITTAIPDRLLILDPEGRYLEIIHAAEDQADTADLTGRHLSEVLTPSDAGRMLEAIQATLQTGQAQVIEYQLPACHGLLTLEGHLRRMEIRGQPAVLLLSRNITERAAHDLERRIAAMAFESQHGMAILDRQDRILRINRAFTRLTGYQACEVIGRNTALLCSARHPPEFVRNIWQTVQQQGSWQGEFWGLRKNGEEYPQWLLINSVRDSQGQITHYILAQTDITERKAAEEKIHYLAFYDALTGLPNRRLLFERLQHSETRLGSGEHWAALMMLDLDSFKNINDLHGHHSGDALLREVARRLQACLRQESTIARLGGDEFVVLLEPLASSHALAMQQLEQIGGRILAQLARPYPVGELTLHSSASIGIVLFQGNQQSVEELLRHADMSMYEAKLAGKNSLRFFDPRMRQQVSDRLSLEEGIRHGLKNGEFILFFQPQYDDRHQLTGAEALVRWQHPRKGLLEPATFIRVAEQAGLIQALDLQVLRLACTQLASLAQNPATARLSLAVNLSAPLLYQANFVEQVLQLLQDSGAPPQSLKLELTESLLLDDMPRACQQINALRTRGIRFSIDDFGTGYSSMTYLQQLPLDQLKIDRSFVHTLPDSSSLAIIRSICALASSLNLEVLAEGVEQESQRQILLDNGCRRFQGYLFGRPMPLQTFMALPELAGSA